MRKLVYSVTFNKYTNSMRNAVANNSKTLDYIDIDPDVPLLIFEDDVEKYQQYGGGISHLICVGEMEITDEERPQGKWLHSSDRPDTLICSVCNCGWDMLRYESKELKYCPNCGSDMRGK